MRVSVRIRPDSCHHASRHVCHRAPARFGVANVLRNHWDPRGRRGPRTVRTVNARGLILPRRRFCPPARACAGAAGQEGEARGEGASRGGDPRGGEGAVHGKRPPPRERGSETMSTMSVYGRTVAGIIHGDALGGCSGGAGADDAVCESAGWQGCIRRGACYPVLWAAARWLAYAGRPAAAWRAGWFWALLPAGSLFRRFAVCCPQCLSGWACFTAWDKGLGLACVRVCVPVPAPEGVCA